MADRKKYVVLDGNALLHRAWHAIPPLTTKDGLVVNAAYGFTNVVEKMRATLKPDYMAVAWDLPGGTFRHEEYKEYKATREKKPDELYAQIPIIQKILSTYGIPSLSVKGYEADDILGTIAALNEKEKNIDTLIVTGDLDTLQLVTPETKVVFFVKGLSEVKFYDEAAINERYGLVPEKLIELKTLVGDKSDNLPGVAGIGDKGASELLGAYGSVEGIFAALKKGELADKYVKKFTGQEAHAKQMKRLVTILRDVPLKNYSLAQAVLSEPDSSKLIPLFRELEFKNLLKKYGEETVESAVKKAKEEPKKIKQRKIKVVLAESVRELHQNRCALIVEAKTQDLFGGSIGSVAIADGAKVFTVEDPDVETLKTIMTFLSNCTTLVAHDIKATLHALTKIDTDLAEKISHGQLVDTMLAAYLLMPGGRDYELSAVTDDVYRAKRDVPEVLAERASFILELADELLTRLEKDGLRKLFAEVEMPVLPVLFRMERCGIAVDEQKLKELSEDFAKTLNGLTKKIYKISGKEFNINSPSQLADILFNEMKLPTKGIKKTKSGLSTAAPELEKLAGTSEIIPLLEEYREVSKLKSTYADALPTLVAPDGRIHTTFNQTIAATGRLSSINPNLQNLPVRTELGREIRKAFVARRGYQLLAADYSQIELRLAAHMAKDQEFIQAFKDGADVHRRTAAAVWNLEEEKVTKEQRAAAKAVNFGILYGIGARSLSRGTGMHFEEAKQFIDRYFEIHAPLREYMDAMKLKARNDGYVETLFGRRRYLPDIHSSMPQLIAAAERMAINMPVQGTQADILKMAMIKIDVWLRAADIDCHMLLQVHDELVFEIKEKDVAKAQKEIQHLMASIMSLDVPLVVDAEVGKRWGDME